jgi:hypothetical protein
MLNKKILKVGKKKVVLGCFYINFKRSMKDCLEFLLFTFLKLASVIF